MNTNLAMIKASRLFPYLRDDPTVFKCPADTYASPAQKQRGWLARVRSYSMNGFMGRPSTTTDSTLAQGRNIYFPSYRQFLHLAAIPSPGSTFVFLEEHPDSINDGLFLNDPGTKTQWSDQPAAYHNGAGSFSFADGHAELHLWANPQTKIPVRFTYTSVTIPPTASADYSWLMARTSVDPTTLGLTKTAGDQFRIVWSALPTNYVLQVSDSVTATPWANTGLVPEKLPGANSTTVEKQGPNQFFRLLRR